MITRLSGTFMLLALCWQPADVQASCRPRPPCPVVGECSPLGVSAIVDVAPQRGKGVLPAALERLDLEARAQGLRTRHVREMAMGMHVIEIEGADAARASRALARFAGVEGVRHVERVHPVRAAANDPLLPQQWALKQTSAGISAELAWTRGRGAGGVVAVIDSGVVDHADLRTNVALASGHDFVSNLNYSGDGNARDGNAGDPGSGYYYGDCLVASSWHGTTVSSVVAATTNNGIGVAAVAPDATVLPLRVLGTGGQGDSADVIDAIYWAAGGDVPGVPEPAGGRLVADVINLSLGWPTQCTVAMQAAIDFARTRGVTVVAAVGNENNTTIFSPASCSGVVAVAATNASGQKASFSNYGPRVDIAAPGDGILAAGNSGTLAPVAGGDVYVQFKGTSAAAPHVAAVAALMQAIDPRSPDEVRSILRATSKPAQCGATACGSGIVNADAAVRRVIETARPTAKIVVATKPISDSVDLLNESSDPGMPPSTLSSIWTFGDGTQFVGTRPPTFTLTCGDVLTATLTVTDTHGFQDTDSVTVEGRCWLTD